MLESRILEATQMMKNLEQKSKHARRNPSKEAQLLHALKPFVPQANHKTLEDTMDFLHLLETLRSIGGNSVHSNGIYDIDQECMSRRKKPFDTPSQI
ncbi:MAG: hypothetical protein FWD97_02040 [Defluviitaleaceae bacterium]|nr:hypothetical protein [Defluviitaleaceae bacterium]